MEANWHRASIARVLHMTERFAISAVPICLLPGGLVYDAQETIHGSAMPHTLVYARYPALARDTGPSKHGRSTRTTTYGERSRDRDVGSRQGFTPPGRCRRIPASVSQWQVCSCRTSETATAAAPARQSPSLPCQPACRSRYPLCVTALVWSLYSCQPASS